MKKKIILLIILIILITISLFLLFNKKNNKVPRMDITLTGSLTLKDINDNGKDIKYPNNKLTINNKEYNITIKGRGHATWDTSKKPYQISFDDKTTLFNYNTKKYVLLANFADPSLLRNDFTYTVAKKMDIKYTNTGEFVDLYVNNEYIGNYYLIPKVEINKSSVDLKDDNAIIMELDNIYYKEETYFTTKYFQDHITIKDRLNENNKGYNSFIEKYNQMEKNIKNKNYKWLKENIDIDSFIKYYIVTNFSKNPDGFRSSLYFYMDGIDDKIHIGAVWDFDVAYNHVDKNPENNDIYKMHDNIEPSILFNELLKINDFKKDLSNYWNNTASKIYKEEINNLDNKIEYLKESGENNSMYWNDTSYSKYTDSLKDWLNKRYKYYNELYK